MYTEELSARIQDEWLPNYLRDCGYEPGGYVPPAKPVGEEDALWFLRAIDNGVVELLPKARLRLPASPLNAMIFWEHSASQSPRRVTIHLEGILSAGMAARLHLDFGWPVPQLGFEYPPGEHAPGRRAFDLGGLSSDGSLRIAGEAKKSANELNHVLAVMARCASAGPHQHEPDEKGITNGHRKWQGLVRCQPAAFFTFGPDHDWSIFAASYPEDGVVVLEPASEDLLKFPR